ncbi:tetratricopeptide repeat protein [Methylobrevis pamukkalensis]|uniref:protein O-GlcNAc transferase n=1 Tax=Methylobrevis pamukkalensis TaxID=1439726 RepID=A0A1E3H1G7_9HYPH|nr:tetratricopeptide repeat protein [Methylobrevis pamukkalensis]ODN70142.1 cellulose synthase subunit BcsC [Methylobrevis pamukkalensis]
MTDPDTTAGRKARLAAAVARHKAGDTDAAIDVYRTLLDETPDDPNLRHLLGVALFQRGDRAAGIIHMKHALAARPDDMATAGNLAQALVDSGSPEEAVPLLRRIVETAPLDAAASRRLAIALSLAGRNDEALVAFDRTIKVGGETDTVMVAKARALGRAGRVAEAIDLLSGHLVRNGVRAEPLVFLAGMLADGGFLEEAAALYGRATALRPQDMALRQSQVSLLRRSGDLDAAFAAGLEALALAPQDPALHVTVGHVLTEAGHLVEALRHYTEAFTLDPAAVDALSSAAWAAMRLDRAELAGSLAARAIDTDPKHADAHLVMATLASELGAPGEAIRMLEAAIASGIENAQLFYKYADTIIAERQRLPEGLTALEKALELEPGHYSAWLRARDAARHLVRHDTLDRLGRHPGFTDEQRRRYAPAPFLAISESDDPAEHLAHARRFWTKTRLDPAQIFAGGARPDHPPPPATDERIVVGYLSSDFHEHATAYLLAELFELHDRRRFSVHAYCYSPAGKGPMRERIRRAADHFIEVRNLSNGDMAKAIARDGVHVLVDLKGWTAGSRTPVVGLRPAPLQVSWLGYPGSTGGDALDYFIADPVVCPPGSDEGFTEKLVRLPGSYQINDRRRRIDPIRPERADFGLPREAFVYASFNQPYKMTPDLVASYARVLDATPGSVLWLFSNSDEATRNLRGVFAARGIAPERIIPSPALDNPKHLARLPLADLCLDSFPVGSHTTASDALWAGVPVLTRPGRAFPSRVAASLLRAVGLSELIMPDEAAFEAEAAALAGDPTRLARMRRHLVDGRDRLELFDTPRFVAGLEAAYVTMVDRWRRGLPAAAFDVERQL